MSDPYRFQNCICSNTFMSDQIRSVTFINYCEIKLNNNFILKKGLKCIPDANILNFSELNLITFI